MKIKIGEPIGISDIGKRENQEDFMMPNPEKVSEYEKCFIVCDGMGGHDNGEIASKIVAQTIWRFIKKEGSSLKDTAKNYDGNSIINNAVTASFEALDKYAESNGSFNMGTTLAMLLFTSQGYLAAHMGDSRIYHYRPSLYSLENPKKGLIYRSWDHSLVNRMVKAGMLTEEEARVYPKKNIITKSLMPGSKDKEYCEIHGSDDVMEGDIFFICSDGVTDSIRDEELFSIFGDQDLTPEAKALQIERICKEKSNDNYTFWLLPVTKIETGERKMMGRIFRLLEIDRILSKSYRGSDPESMLSVKEIYDKLKETDAVSNGEEEYEIPPKEEKTLRKDLCLFLKLRDYLNAGDKIAGKGFEIIEKEKIDTSTGRKVKCYTIPPAKSLFRHMRSDYETELLFSMIRNLENFDLIKNLSSNILSGGSHPTTQDRNLPACIDLNILPPKNSEIFRKIVEAISQREVIKVRYRKINEIDNEDLKTLPGEKREEILLPLQIKRFGNRWVFFGAVEQNGYIINFSLDQISSVESTGLFYSQGARLRMKDIFKNVVGPTLPREKSKVESQNEIYEPTNPDDGLQETDVVFFALPNRVNHTTYFPLMKNGVQKDITVSYSTPESKELMRRFPNGKVFMLEKVYITRELKEEIFKRMDDIVVLYPATLKEEMMRIINSLGRLYSIPEAAN